MQLSLMQVPRTRFPETFPERHLIACDSSELPSPIDCLVIASRLHRSPPNKEWPSTANKRVGQLTMTWLEARLKSCVKNTSEPQLTPQPSVCTRKSVDCQCEDTHNDVDSNHKAGQTKLFVIQHLRSHCPCSISNCTHGILVSSFCLVERSHCDCL